MHTIIKVSLILLLLLIMVCSIIYGIYWLYFKNIGTGLALLYISLLSFSGMIFLYLNLKNNITAADCLQENRDFYYRGYTFNKEGWSIWPFKKIYLKWSDITWVISLKCQNKSYQTIVRFLSNGHINKVVFTTHLSWFNPKLSSKYCNFLKYACNSLPADKICLETRELAEYNTCFVKSKNCKSEIIYQESVARQLWIEFRFEDALRICDNILKKAPDNFWGMKIKACVTKDISETIYIVERMLKLKYFDSYVLKILIGALITQKASTERIDHYMNLFREHQRYTDFGLEFCLLDYYLSSLKDIGRSEKLLGKIALESQTKIDPIYMEYVNAFCDKITKLKGSGSSEK